jgi:hypothetical protein
MITNEFQACDASPAQILLIIDPTLHDYFRDGMQRDRIEGDPHAELVAFLAGVLNDTAYPIEAHLTETGEIRLSYQPRAFADPIF